MSSKLLRPNSARKVIDLAVERAARRTPGARHHTLMVRVGAYVADEEVIRHIGLDESLTLAETHRVLAVCFNLPAGGSPARFTREVDDAGRLDADLLIGDFLRGTGDRLFFHWGLWSFHLHLGDRWPRDAGTPRALCVGGIGQFQGRPLDLTVVNAELTGHDTFARVLQGARPEVRGVIERSEMYDFVPLLQAMDLSRIVELGPVHRQLARLPLEEPGRGTDAFWASVLGLACLANPELTDTVIEDTMTALGWGDMDADDVRGMCADSLAALAAVGGYGPDAASPVDRLDLYRELIRAPRG